MTNPLHHTIRERPSAQLLLARQWVERINYELETLKAYYPNELPLWRDRLEQDIKTTVQRNAEDGYRHQLNITLSSHMGIDDYPHKALRFVPYIVSVLNNEPVTKVAIYSKQDEVQS